MKYLTALFVFLALLLFDVVMIAGFVGGQTDPRLGQCSGMTPERRLPFHVEPILVG